LLAETVLKLLVVEQRGVVVLAGQCGEGRALVLLGDVDEGLEAQRVGSGSRGA